MRIALAQFNPLVGDLSGNSAKIIKLANEAKLAGADILFTPEMSLCGAGADDLLLRNDFQQQINSSLDQLLELDGISLVVGHPAKIGAECFNAATVMRNGNRLGQYHKMSLCNSGVYDECRYFSPGAEPLIFEQNGVKIALLIGTDATELEISAAAQASGAELLVVMDAAAFYRDKSCSRYAALEYRVEETGLPAIYLNAVGAQDELVFDGGSFALNRQGKLVAQAECFVEELIFLDLLDKDIQPSRCCELPDDLESIYLALLSAVRDYVTKNKFSSVILGMSGGIDSALTLAIAVDALGKDKVSALMMPSPYTAQISIEDANKMLDTLGVKRHEIDIWPIYQQITESLANCFGDSAEDVTEENIQARIRGMLLMALSNKNASLVLNTGNKSELTTGYCTLYGDMVGGFAVLKDVEKTLVYELANWRNLQQEIIPQRIIRRAPSAELRANQTDQDNLPSYDLLDAIMQRYVEQNMSIEQIVQDGFPVQDVEKVVHLLLKNEYKRRQAPIGPRISQRAFGKDWRYPITNYFA